MFIQSVIKTALQNKPQRTSINMAGHTPTQQQQLHTLLEPIFFSFRYHCPRHKLPTIFISSDITNHKIYFKQKSEILTTIMISCHEYTFCTKGHFSDSSTWLRVTS